MVLIPLIIQNCLYHRGRSCRVQEFLKVFLPLPLRYIHTAALRASAETLPIHFEWGDVTLCRTALRFRRFASVARFES